MCYNTSSNNHLELLFNRDLYGVYLSRLVDTIQVKKTMQKEIWLPILGYESLYEVSNMGRVKSLRRNVTLKCLKNSFGYYSVILCNNTNRKQFRVHRLVAQAFISNLENKCDVNHIDNNRINNNLSNLEWATRKENVQHAIRQQRMVCGEKSLLCKLKQEDVVEIRKSNLTPLELSLAFKVSRSNIYSIKKRQVWKHL